MHSDHPPVCVFDGRLGVVADEVDSLQLVLSSIRRLTVYHLNQHDASTPHVNLVVVWPPVATGRTINWVG